MRALLCLFIFGLSVSYDHLVVCAQTSVPTGMPSGTPTSPPTDYLRTEIQFVAFHSVDGAGSAMDFKLNYRSLYEGAVSSSIYPPTGVIAASQTFVQVVTRASSRLSVQFKITLIMERHNYGTINHTFEALSLDLLTATVSRGLQQRLNSSINAQYGGNIPGIAVSDFRASFADMKINYLRSHSPTSMPTIGPEDSPRKRHSVGYSIGAIVVGGAAVIVVTFMLDNRAKNIIIKNRVSPTPGQTISDINSAKKVIRAAVPFLEITPEFTTRIERFHRMSFHEAGSRPFLFIYTMVSGMMNGAVWKHHRWVGSLVHLKYIPRYVRVFTAMTYAALMLLFSLFFIRDLRDDHLPIGFRLLSWEFVHAIVLATCACGLISSCLYTMIEAWYYTIIASYVRPIPEKKVKRRGGGKVDSLNGSPEGRRGGSVPSMATPYPHPPVSNAADVAETREPVISPPRALGGTPTSHSRRISVRTATMDTPSFSVATSTPALSAAVRRGSVSGPLKLVVGRRNNIRPRNNDDTGLPDETSKGPTSFAPVPTRFSKFSVPVSRSGVHNVSRLQEEIMYCRSTLMVGEKPKTSPSRQRDRRASSANSKFVTTKGLKRCNQFDRIWGLNKFGRISENRPTGTLSNSLYGRARSSFQLVVADLFSVHRAAGIELRKMQRPSVELDPAFQEQDYLLRNRYRIVQLFHLDVLPPLERAIVYNQIARQERLTEPISVDRRVKVIGLIQILICFLVTVFCIYWYSRSVSEVRQSSIVILFLFWLGLDVLVVSTLSAAVKHVFIPHIAIDEVTRVVGWLTKTLDQLFGSISAGLVEDDMDEHVGRAKGGSSAGTRQKELFKKMQSNIAGDINTSNMPSFVSLNAAHHFFLSSRIAGLFPISFPEVKAIYSFHTLWPKRNMDILYDAEVEAKKCASGKGTESTRLNIVHVDGSGSVRPGESRQAAEKVTPPAQWMWYPKLLPYLLLYYFMGLPLRVQDMCIDMFSWGITLGFLYLHAWLYFVEPFYLVIPFPALLLLGSVCYMTGIFRDGKLLNYPRVSKDVGLWIMENKETDDPVGLETLYVHDALKEQKILSVEEDKDDDGKPKSDFLAALAAARDLDVDEDSDGEEGNNGLTEEERHAFKKQKMMKNLEAEIVSRAHARKGDPSSSPHREENKIVLEALRPAPLIINASPQR